MSEQHINPQSLAMPVIGPESAAAPQMDAPKESIALGSRPPAKKTALTIEHNGMRRRAENCLLAFAVSALLTAVAFFALGWWPFGGGSILTGDLNGLYVNYIADMWRRVRQGGFFYSFGKLAGGSTLGLFAYYMNSPFNLLYLLFPTRDIPQVAGACFWLRTALTAATFCWYLQHHFQKSNRWFVLLAQGYALCAFCVVYNQNIIWMDVVWLLPLVLGALDDLMEFGAHWRFTGLLVLCVLFNFYTTWAVCLFCVLYFFWQWESKSHERGALGRRFGVFAASGVLAAGLTLAFLVPVLLEVQQSKGELFAFSFCLEPQFALWQLPYRLFFGTFFWNDVTNGLPNIYCGVFAAALAVLYFFSAAPRREKLASAGVLMALVLSFWVKGINLIWHGFKEPVWFPYRYSFVFSAVLLLLAAKGLLFPPKSKKSYLGAGAVLIVWLAGYWPAAGQNASLAKLLVSAALCAAALAVTYGRSRAAGVTQSGQKMNAPQTAKNPAECATSARKTTACNKKVLRCGVAVAVVALAAMELAGNTVLSLRKFESYSVGSFQTFYDNANAALATLPQNGENGHAYRVEKNFMHTLNDPFLLGYWGISHYSSTKASTAKQLLEELGYVGYSTYGWGSTGVADSILGIRYLYTQKSATDGSLTRAVPGHYTAYQASQQTSGDLVWENATAFPLAYLADTAALQVDASLGEQNTFAFQNAALSALVPGTPDALSAADLHFSATEKGTLAVSFSAPCTGPCYLAIPNTDNLTPIDVVVDGKLYAQYFEGDSFGGVLPLGSFSAGQQVQLVLGFLDKPDYRAAVQIYSLQTAVLASAANEVRATAPQQVSIQEGGHIAVTAQVGHADTMLVLPFAYEENWRASVNGTAVKVQPLFGGLLAVELPQGECHVQLEYVHPGVWQGAVGSLVFALAAVLWQMRERRFAKKMR